MSSTHADQPALHQMSALTQARLLRDKQISCEELVRAYLVRIEQHNPTLHAFVRIYPERALARARRWDRKGPPTAPQSPTFWGVPSGIKDTDPMRGSMTQIGSRAYRYLWTPLDGPVTGRFRRAGFNLLGKMATSEFAIMPVTEPDTHPPCRNPWNTEHSPGGSSGGSASAVAAGLLPIAHAADGGGSIRIPAAFCHLFGIKPSRDLMPNFYKPIDPIGMSTVNAVSRDVDDTAAMLDAMLFRHYDPRRPLPDSFLAQCQHAPGALRIRFCTVSPLGPVHPAIEAAVRQTASTLEALGHHVEEGAPPEIELDEFMPLWFRMVANMPAIRHSILQPPTRWLRTQGKQITQAQANTAGIALQQKVIDWFGDADIWLSPTVALTPPKIGAWAQMSGEDAFAQATKVGAFTAIFNASGQPAANIPAGITEDSLPFGVQIIGKQGQDTLLLQLAKQLEEAMPWSHRHPGSF